jgi:hypothetical protein
VGRVGIEPTTPSFSWIEFYAENTLKLGADDGIRTHDLLVGNEKLYH